MKKVISTLLVGAMLVCMAPVAGLFAAEAAPDYTSIDSADEYVEFVKAVNAGTYTNNADHKVNVNLDLSSYPVEDVVIKAMVGDMFIDFQGHTVSGIVREVDAVQDGNYGLIADWANGYAEIRNVKLKDCSLTVNGDGVYAKAGAVLGYSDRAYVGGDISLENVTIKSNTAGAIGVCYGHHQYFSYRSGEANISMKNVLIDATGASVGLIAGRFDGGNDVNPDGTVSGYNKIVLTGLSVADSTIKGNKAVTATTLYGELGGSGIAENASTAETATVSFATVDNATGYVDPNAGNNDNNAGNNDNNAGNNDNNAGNNDNNTGNNDNNAGNNNNAGAVAGGDATVVAVVLAVVALIGVAVISKKRTAC